jgi:hypothetical protein
MSLIESSLVAPANFRFRGRPLGREGRNQALDLLAAAAILSANLGDMLFEPGLTRLAAGEAPIKKSLEDPPP